mgnify:CR=1 FL=1
MSCEMIGAQNCISPGIIGTFFPLETNERAPGYASFPRLSARVVEKYSKRAISGRG